MLRVPISMAEVGMKLALPVLHPQRGTMLLSEGYVLEPLLIRRLGELEVRDIWVDFPDTEQIRQYISPVIMHEHGQMVGTVAELFDSGKHDAFAEVEFADYRKTIQGLIEELVSEPTAASYIVEMGGSADSRLR